MHSLSLGRANISFRFTFVRRNFIDQTKRKMSLYHLLKKTELTFKLQRTANSRGGGPLGYFLGGYVPPGIPNWRPALEKNSPKIDTPF